MKILGVEFAPLNIPLERRFQTLAVAYSLSTYFFGFVPLLFFIYLMFTQYYYIPILYFSWIYYDRKTPSQGGRPFKWMRQRCFYKNVVNYFPITLHKTANLDPEENYIFGYHPHGILPFGVFGNFVPSFNFNALFPGITPKIVTLDLNFVFPICRDLMLFRGHISSKKESIEWALTKCGTGNAIVLVVGGAQEALDAVPNTMKLTIKSRKGFVKIALMNGASLVPVISFGENETYYQSGNNDESVTRKIQITLKKLLSFSLPLFWGRGIFQYSFGILPYRTPIHTVVGKPIEVNRISEPTKEQIDELHERYMKELLDLYNINKSKYSKNQDNPADLILQ